MKHELFWYWLKIIPCAGFIRFSAMNHMEGYSRYIQKEPDWVRGYYPFLSQNRSSNHTTTEFYKKHLFPNH